MTSPDGLWKESNNFWQNASHHHSMKKSCPNPLCVLAVELIYVFMFTRLRTARFPLLKCEKNRIFWFTKLTVLFYLECGRVGGVLGGGFVVHLCSLKKKRANRI